MKKSEKRNQLHLVLERICSVYRAELRDQASTYGLKLVQLEALIYFSVANRYSDTASALADYLGVTKGTASQTVIALQRHGLVQKKADDDDGRVLHCKVTAAGRDVLKAAHPAAVLTDLSDDRLTEALTAATQLLRAFQTSRGLRVFGQCRTCSHFRREGSMQRCGLTGEPLTKGDSLLICREHTSAA